ncbi:methyltransferase family protein [Cellulomonas bogoriensis]|nr:isoprenylcysteine carboxylmethyltransferase family protein [Cellulomonas bogoriensis]
MMREHIDRYVVGQALAVGALLWPGPSRWPAQRAVRAVALTLMLAGGGFSVVAAALHGTRLTPRVEPHEDIDLLVDGPYAVSRHPVYGGLLVATAGWVLLRRRPEPLVAWSALLAVLLAKTRGEEQRLLARFGPAYEAYRARTPRLVGVARRS